MIYKNLYEVVEAKTASCQLVASDVGKLITNRGASGAVTITLPDTDTIDAGWNVKFFVVADQSLTFAAPTADTMVAFNNAAADSVGFATTSEKIGAGGTITWDGTGWLVALNLGIDSQTPTVTDA